MKTKWLSLPLLIPTSIVGLLATSCNDATKSEQKVYKVRTVVDPRNIDWTVIPQAPIDIFKWTDNGPKYDTFAQMIYIKDQGFAIRMLSYEPDPLVDPSPEGRDVYKDSCLEAYLNFGQENKYLNVEVNSVGRNCQEFGLPWSAGQGRTPIEDLEWKFNILTYEKEEQYWDVIVTISLEYVSHWYPGITVTPGFTFTGNFFKVCGTSGEHEHYGMWNDMDNKDHTFHDPTQFGKFIVE